MRSSIFIAIFTIALILSLVESRSGKGLKGRNLKGKNPQLYKSPVNIRSVRNAQPKEIQINIQQSGKSTTPKISAVVRSKHAAGSSKKIVKSKARTISLPDKVGKVVERKKTKVSKGPGKRVFKKKKVSTAPGKRTIKKKKVSKTPGKRTIKKKKVSTTPGKRTIKKKKVSTTPGKRTIKNKKVSTAPGKLTIKKKKVSTAPGKLTIKKKKVSTTPGKRTIKKKKVSTKKPVRKQSVTKRSKMTGNTKTTKISKTANTVRKKVVSKKPGVVKTVITKTPNTPGAAGKKIIKTKKKTKVKKQGKTVVKKTKSSKRSGHKKNLTTIKIVNDPKKGKIVKKIIQKRPGKSVTKKTKVSRNGKKTVISKKKKKVVEKRGRKSKEIRKKKKLFKAKIYKDHKDEKKKKRIEKLGLPVSNKPSTTKTPQKEKVVKFLKTLPKMGKKMAKKLKQGFVCKSANDRCLKKSDCCDNMWCNVASFKQRPAPESGVKGQVKVKTGVCENCMPANSNCKYDISCCSHRCVDNGGYGQCGPTAAERHRIIASEKKVNAGLVAELKKRVFELGHPFMRYYQRK